MSSILRELRQGERVLSLINEHYPQYHPIIGLAKIAHTTQDEQLEFNCHKALARYVEPELKSVEVSQAPPESELLRVIFEDEDVLLPSQTKPALEKLPVEELLDAPVELKIEVA